MKASSKFTRLAGAVVMLISMLWGNHALAWGSQGHQLIGGIADQMLNDRARAQVHSILGYDLHVAATWPDCVRSVAHPSARSFVYRPDPQHPEYRVPCTAFETPAETARMEDYVRRNWSNCDRPRGKGCHTTFHFADIAVQRDRYDRTFAGASDHDIVSAINAALLVLQGKPAPSPFSIKDKKEALLLLAHFVGDIHQPLHVGAVYLDPTGRLVDPDTPGVDEAATSTHGGNSIVDTGSKLHSEWDSISPKFGSPPKPFIITAAKSVPPTAGSVDAWAGAWASDTVLASHGAFQGLAFQGAGAGAWTATEADRKGYLKAKADLQEVQIAKAGAQLASLLNAVWP